jgi:uncharacterized iron-regulated membrane protein
MKSLRTFVFWCHLAVGSAAATVVAIMAFTGALLAYQKQMTAWADRRAVDANPPVIGAPPLAVEELLQRVIQSAAMTPSSITLRSRADAPAEVSFGRDRRELVNVYTGARLGEGATGMRSFFRVVTAWHRTLGATGTNRTVARQITDAANLGFLFLVLSGVFLWWPRNWTSAAVRNVTLFRRGLSGRPRDFNWHNTAGFWSALPLAVIVASGVVMSYRWANDLAYRAAGDTPPVQTAGAPRGDQQRGAERVPTIAGLNPAFAAAERRVAGWTTITAQLPAESDKNVTFSLDAGTGGQPQLRSQLVLDRATNREVRFEPFSSQSPGRRVRTIFRFAHTGEVLGVAGQTIAGIASLGAVVLACTGLALVIRRLTGSLRSRQKTA